MGGASSSPESVREVLSLLAHNPLVAFTEMWYWVFLWALFSSIFVHGSTALLAFVSLRRHRKARFFSVAIAVMGVLAPITGGIITSAAVAGVYRAAGKTMLPLEALVFGSGQTVITVIISAARLLASL
ncbi:transmembrane protein 170B [Petromyzon marinus]|uniref:Transmembrane protein 170B-like n=1 Tax=Petromyzon marinus TaxID=7757 RepID=A0AAJ7X184_PETMA|nr:transmembrane protein 170B-like [Petromyzon marinus]XP_061404383.1 transmembrane protein 170B-like [Lethenteron reissneri]XP_061404384.1 transmembrane protein 170B-like [Lethenteron reissneri]